MLVKIKFPKHCATVDDKREFIKKLVEWGNENLNNQEDWKHTHLLLSKRFVNFNTVSISFNMESETDAMALKIVWCET